MKTRFAILTAALAASLFGVPAFAGSNASSSSGSNAAGTGIGIGGGNAQSTSSSGASSGSTAIGGIANGGSATLNGGYTGAEAAITINNPAAGDPSGDPTSTENLVTTGTQRIITTGQAIAPSIYSNNVCALSASAAGGFLGGAFALGFDRIDKGCDLRATASLLGHFAEIYSIAATHAADPAIRARAEHLAVTYATWANNLLCMQNPELAAAAPPDSNMCRTVATQAGLQVVPAPVATVAPAPAIVAAPRPIVAAIDPPPKPVYTGPHNYGPHEGAVPSSWHTGPVSGYTGPDYTDEN